MNIRIFVTPSLQKLSILIQSTKYTRIVEVDWTKDYLFVYYTEDTLCFNLNGAPFSYKLENYKKILDRIVTGLDLLANECFDGKIFVSTSTHILAAHFDSVACVTFSKTKNDLCTLKIVPVNSSKGLLRLQCAVPGLPLAEGQKILTQFNEHIEQRIFSRNIRSLDYKEL